MDAVMQQRLLRYFKILTDGCGNDACPNLFCASSARTPSLTREQAALKALELLRLKAPLCTNQSNSAISKVNSVVAEEKVEAGKTQNSSACFSTPTIESSTIEKNCSEINQSADLAPSTSLRNNLSSQNTVELAGPLDEHSLDELIGQCLASKDYSVLRRRFGMVFSNSDLFSESFLFEKSCADKQPESPIIDVDIASVGRVFDRLVALPEEPFLPALTNALCYLFENSELDLRYRGQSLLDNQPRYLNIFVSTLEILLKLNDAQGVDQTFAKFCRALARLPAPAQCSLAKFWSSSSPTASCLHPRPDVICCGDGSRNFDVAPTTSDLSAVGFKVAADVGAEMDVARRRLLNAVRSTQQFLTMRVLTGHFGANHQLQNDLDVASAVCLLRVLFYAALVGGRLIADDEGASMTDDPHVDYCDEERKCAAFDAKMWKKMSHADQVEERNLTRFWKSVKTSRFLSGPEASRQDVFAKELKVCSLDCHAPLIPLDEFYNELVSENIEVDIDFANFIKISEEGDDSSSLFDQKNFSFMLFPFLLDPATKMRGLFFFNRINMHNERRQALFDTVLNGAAPSPHLRLKLRRENVLHDALAHLEIIAAESPNELRKQLFIEFEHEQAVDEGGVSKEFYQLITAQLFNLDYGMFTYNESTRLFWFNRFCADCSSEYLLIGMLFGLAVYNSVILDVQFPLVLYTKLMNCDGTLENLKEFDPVLYGSLKFMLDYDGDDFCDAFYGCTFRIALTDQFGSEIFHDLIDKGDQVVVTKKNRKRFVRLYVHYLLDKSIARQFEAFKRGFSMVVDESPLFWLFRPDELDAIVCGCKELDFAQLESSTEYDNGFDVDHPTIKNFWQVVRQMTEEERRSFLQFATGTDRVPVGGMSKLRFVVARNGPDTENLPTAQTCFNVLLLPDYSTKEKLQNRLLKAISYCKGFGIV